MKDSTSISAHSGRLRGCAGAILAMPVALGAFTNVARAQVARVSSVERTVEKRGRSARWHAARAGTALNVGDRLRTGRRSKADVKFVDGSILRLGQMSSIEIQSGRRVRLTSGKMLFAHLKPGRVLTSSGTAQVKGYWAWQSTLANNFIGTGMAIQGAGGSMASTLSSFISGSRGAGTPCVMPAWRSTAVPWAAPSRAAAGASTGRGDGF